jgi:hypothetical protein
VVEAWVDEVKGDDLDVPDFAKEMMAGGGGTRTVAGPEPGTVCREESIAFAFEGETAGDVKDRVASVLEPAAEVLFFALALGIEEAAESNDAVALETCVGGEDHVGRAGLRLDEFDIGDLRHCFVQVLPLLCCALARGGVDVSSHPRIDNVVDVVELWRAHEVCGPRGCNGRNNYGEFDWLRAHE